MDITKKYFVRPEEVESKPGCWNTLIVHIFLREEDGTEREIGQYPRNYPSFVSKTFCPFKQGDKEYALYSTDYTATRVMELPSCKDIAGEEPESCGFCPTGYYVPGMDEEDWNDVEELAGQIGFVCGCVWGDDTSWKLQVLDLSRVSEGKFSRDDRLGYVELPDMPLKDAIRFIFAREDGFARILVGTQQCFDMNLNDPVACDNGVVCEFLRELFDARKQQVEPDLVFQFLYGMCNAHCSIASDLCQEFYEKFRVLGLVEKGYIMRRLFEWLHEEKADKMVNHYFELARMGREQDERREQRARPPA
jgi:hypothetical protein